MRVPFVDLVAQHEEVADEVRGVLADVFRRAAFIGGWEVTAFEQEYARLAGAQHCVGVGNGTDALELALRAVGVDPGGEVVLPANTFIATAEAVSRIGAAPVLVDVDEEHLLIDPDAVARAITPRTQAVVPVHLFGQLAPVEAVLEVCDAAGVPVVEDAAQSQGARRHGRGAGAWGRAAGTSFYPGKNLGAAGDAGAVTTDDPEVADLVRMLGAHGSGTKYVHDVIGMNSRLDTVQAVYLRAKLSRLEKWNDLRRRAAERYAELLADLPGVRLPATLAGNDHVWHLYVVEVDERDRVLHGLGERGIGAGVHYPTPVHLTGAYAGLGRPRGSFPVAEEAADRILSLPMFPHLTPRQQEYVAEVLTDLVGGAAMRWPTMTSRASRWSVPWAPRRRQVRAEGGDTAACAPHVLIIVQNLPVPLDRRVWLECLALRARGYEVSVICPKGPDDPAREVLDGVEILKYRPAPEATGFVGYAVEFSYSWLRTAVLARRIWRRHRFHVIQACNPPDTYWLLARWYQRQGVRFLFDHHDLNPELFLSRFGEPSGVRERAELGALCWLERRTFHTADKVTSTNESYRRVAIERGGLDPHDVRVVRSGPDTRAMRPLVPARPRPEADAAFVLAYVGIMGPQDGVDTVLHVMDDLVHRRGRSDVRAVLMGFGDCLNALRDECGRLGLDDVVEFTGRVDRSALAERLSGADVGLCPDLRSPLNDVSTMNKTMEYMAYCLPSVSFDLHETRVSGADTVLYVPSGDTAGFADAVEGLLDDDDLRVDMGLRARRRVVELLDWRAQERVYVGVLDELTGHRSPPRVDDEVATPCDAQGRAYVDLADEAALRAFVRDRGRAPAPLSLPRQRVGTYGQGDPPSARVTGTGVAE